ncbi:MAG: ACP S-malonyltransferase [Mariprofundaceae bacterium]|nr:ACP S-malonyltransferase [Mariprofundaceae bacterium]
MNPSLAFLFPGQGSQSKGMLADFLANETVVQTTFEEASDVLAYDMQALVLQDEQQKLDQTQYTQAALLTASIAMFRAWKARGGHMPAHMAGHSLGEYSALVAADVIDFSDAVALVSFRGQAMVSAVPQGIGKMAAIIGLDDQKLVDLCADVSSDDQKVWAANFNCPGQLVVAGHALAVEKLMLAAKEAGAKRALPLAVSAPSHTPLMQPAADAIQKKLSQLTLHSPSCHVWSNARACSLSDVADIQSALVEQLVSPVRWTESIQAMSQLGVTSAVEMGAGKVLSGLVRRIDKTLSVALVSTPEMMDKAVNA